VAGKAPVATTELIAVTDASMDPEAMRLQIVIVDSENQYRQAVTVKTEAKFDEPIASWSEAANSPPGDWQDFYMQFPKKAVGYDFTYESEGPLDDLTDVGNILGKGARHPTPGGPLVD
jgi:hypothetical protein